MSEDLPRGERRNTQLKAKAKEDLRIRKLVIVALMSEPNGRRYIWSELEIANVFSQTFVPGAPDITGFKEGQRSIGNRLLMEVTAWAPNQYILMTKENASVEIEEIPDE